MVDPCEVAPHTKGTADRRGRVAAEKKGQTCKSILFRPTGVGINMRQRTFHCLYGKVRMDAYCALGAVGSSLRVYSTYVSKEEPTPVRQKSAASIIYREREVGGPQ